MAKKLCSLSIHCFLDRECMKVQLDNFEKIGVPHVRYFSGRFEGFQDNHSIDGQITFDLVKEYKFAEIIATDVMPAIEALNLKLQAMKDYQFALNLDTDETLEGNWQEFESNLKIVGKKHSNEKLLSVPFEDKTGVYEYKTLQKLYHNPETMELRYAHMWFFDKVTNEQLKPKLLVNGIKIIQDDAPRPDWRERLQCRYQQMNRGKEAERQQEYIQDEIKKGNLKGKTVNI